MRRGRIVAQERADNRSELVDMETDKWRREMEPKMEAAKEDFNEGSKVGLVIFSILAIVVFLVWLIIKFGA